MFVNYYELLGIDKNASQEDIDRAFAEKTKFWHPDENPSPQDREKMQKLLEAKFILSHPQIRQLYDQELVRYENFWRQHQALGQSVEDYNIADKKLYMEIRNAQVMAKQQLEREEKTPSKPSNFSAKGCLIAFLKGFFLTIGMMLVYMLLLKACGQI